MVAISPTSTSPLTTWQVKRNSAEGHMLDTSRLNGEATVETYVHMQKLNEATTNDDFKYNITQCNQ